MSALPIPNLSLPAPISSRAAGRALVFLIALGFAVSCSSGGRRPATGFTDDPMVEPPPDATGGETPAPAPRATENPDPSSLSADEINAVAPTDRVTSDALDVGALTVDELNARGLLRDIRFDYDSADLSDEARAILDDNAAWLQRHPTVTVLAEGHCDERGTVEYNLALGEERARAMRVYLVRLGVEAERIRTISYGKEFPLDPGHDESAWRRNRRGHLEITGR